MTLDGDIEDTREEEDSDYARDKAERELEDELEYADIQHDERMCEWDT